MDIKNILLEIFNDAKDGVIHVSDEDFNIGFNTSIDGELKYYNDNNDLCLNIRNLDSFINSIELYIKKELELKRHSIDFFDDRLNIKFLISYLFVNAGTYDFMEPEKYIEKRIKAFDDITLSKYNNGIDISLTNIFDNEHLNIVNKMQSVFMETPYKIETSIVSNDSDISFKLPEISYMIVEENGKKVCYIYSILNKESTYAFNPMEEKFKKNIARKLYKLNKGISDIESQEFKDYKEGNSDYYPENITDVSVSSVLSLYVFINLIKDKVDKIKGVPYLPIRYYSRDIAKDNCSDLERKEQLAERNQMIQTNLTDKFIRTFRRVEQHIECLNIDSYPYEIDDYLNMSLNGKKDIVNNEVIDSIKL